MKSKLILIGGGGHCKSCIDVIEQEAKYEIVGIIDLPEKKGEKISGYEVIGNDNEYEKFIQLGYDFLVTVGQIKTASVRKQIFEKLKSQKAKIATIISPLAYVSKNASVNQGTIIMHKAFVNSGAQVGENCILNTACVIEHDVEVREHCHVSTSSVINGDCKIGNETFIGSNSTILNQINIGSNVVVGAGSVVIHNITDNSTIVGVPAKNKE